MIMKQIKQFNRLILALAAALTLSLAGTAAAEHGSGSGSTNSGQSAENETEITVATVSNTGELHKKGADELNTLRAQHKEQSADHRKNVCEAHKQGLETKFTNIVNNSQKIQDRITSVFDKAVAYKTDNNLSPTNFDDLVAKAQAAKQDSADSIANLKAVTPSLDCNNVSVASDVATFKAAAKETRDNLKAYRSAVKAVVKSILDTKKTSDTTEGSQQ
jgi:hypothetical protein